MVPGVRPLADSFEIRFPGLAALAVRALGRAPAAVRRRVLADVFARAEHAFNRGDLDAVFALFADEVEYTPPPPLYDGPPIVGRERVRRFWEQTRARFDEMRITNLEVEETAPSRFVRTAELFHRSPTEELRYRIRQTTELHAGRVIRQTNESLSP
jgi:ketosteroid isomerase-like protein